MRCLTADRMYAYLEGELLESEARAGAAHLAACPACRDAVETRRRIVEAAETLPAIEVPADFAVRVMARIPPAKSRPTILGWLAATAAGIATVGATLFAAVLLSGRSLPHLLVGISQFLWSNIQGLAAVLAKGVTYTKFAFKILFQVAGRILEGFQILTSFIGPEVPIICLGLVIILALAGGLVWSRRLSMEKYHDP